MKNALSDGNNVYIFTCDGWNYMSRFKYEEGEYNIYQLPDFKQYDGVIINSGTIHDLKIGEELIEKIKQAGIPCVSFNRKWEEAVCIMMENETGIHAIVNHPRLTTVHRGEYAAGEMAYRKTNADDSEKEKCIRWNDFW